LTDDERTRETCGGCGADLAFALLTEQPATETEARQEADTSRPHRPRLPVHERPIESRRELMGWCTMRVGLGFLVLGLMLWLVCCLALLFVLGWRDPRIQAESTTLLTTGCTLGALLAAVLVLMGIFVTCAVPESSGAKLWAGLCAVMLVSLLGLQLYQQYVQRQRARDPVYQQRELQRRWERAGVKTNSPGTGSAIGMPDVIDLLTWMQTLLGLLGSAFYLLALRGVARAFGRYVLGRLLAVYLLCSLFVQVSTSLLLFSGLLDPFPPRWILFGLLVPQVPLLLVFLILVDRVRAAVTRAILRE
jgi:hypothetical protein